MHWISRKGWALAGGLLLAAAVPALAVPQPPSPAPPPALSSAQLPAAVTEEPARRIPAADARQALAQGNAVLVDVRPKAAYDVSHAQGAISIPLSEIEARAGELPKGKLVVTYCTWGAEHTSARAVLMLRQKGFTQVACLLGGLDGWTKAGGTLVNAQK